MNLMQNELFTAVESGKIKSVKVVLDKIKQNDYNFDSDTDTESNDSHLSSDTDIDTDTESNDSHLSSDTESNYSSKHTKILQQALFISCYRGHYDIYKLLSKLEGVNVDYLYAKDKQALDWQEYSIFELKDCLFAAVYSGNFEIIKELLPRRDNMEYFYDILQLSVYSNNGKIFEYICNHVKNVDRKDYVNVDVCFENEKEKAYYIAVILNQKRICRFLKKSSYEESDEESDEESEFSLMLNGKHYLPDLDLKIRYGWNQHGWDIEMLLASERGYVDMVFGLIRHAPRTGYDQMIIFLAKNNLRKFNRKRPLVNALESEYFLKPPNIDPRPVFKSGGPWVMTESEWNEINLK